MKKTPFYILTLGIIIMAVTGAGYARDSKEGKGSSESNSCIQCHGDAAKMRKLGYPEFVFNQKDVERQTGMTASCEMCHDGNPDDNTVKGAHEGILGLSVVMKKGSLAVPRRELKGEDRQSVRVLKPEGDFAGNRLFPRVKVKGEKLEPNPRVSVIQWHDKDMNTLAYNPGIAERTCGACHSEAVKSYAKSEMGSVLTQSQYETWVSPTGPHSCGLWTARTEKPGHNEFTTANMDKYNKASTARIDKEQAFSNQRNCNTCHPGCLDCHYAPFDKWANDAAGKLKEPAVHTFSFTPTALSCLGGGRAQICHAGPQERRRGAGYLKGNFARIAVADPQNENSRQYIETPDVHAAKYLACADCHKQNHQTHTMGDQVRNPEPEMCAKCHDYEVSAHKGGIHKRLSCEACHTPLVAGYAFNFWAPGKKLGMETPLDRHPFYNVNAMQPIILKSKNGQWNPYHVVPHITTNVRKEEVKLSKQLLFRNKPDVKLNRQHPSKDAFAVTGIYEGSKEEGTVMAWLNIDKVSHATAKARSCASCHGSAGAQKVSVDYKWMDKPEAAYKDVLAGRYTLVADKNGLRVEDLSGREPKSVPEGLKPLAGKWNLKGNFSIPPIKDKKRYARQQEMHERVIKAGGRYHSSVD